jgi:hypothetical protein
MQGLGYFERFWAVYCPRVYTGGMTNQPLSDEERQAYIDKLPADQVNPDAEATFDDAIERAAKPKQSKPETPDPSDGYTDTQTHSDTTEDISGSHSDTSHQ